jgi:cell division protein FtsI (penicillin-binding protein 3)
LKYPLLSDLRRQIARAYGVFASGGLLRPVTILKRDTPVAGTQVISQKTADAVREMMKAVTEEGGTAVGAAVPGYTVAGKTGTVKRTSSRTRAGRSRRRGSWVSTR